MKDLKFASKDIITALRETVWALKKDNFTAEDCLVRIRNFIQPFNRYYSHIHFRVEGEAPTELSLHYTKALHLVRIVQEAVTNSIKYASAQNIYVRSSAEKDHWRLVVADDGVGFDYDSMKEKEVGNGLTNISQRAVEAGFIVNVQSSPNEGTIVSILI
jgi:signal transduction histidine kinase